MQSAVIARQRNENPNSSILAEILKLLAHSSYDYQNMDSRQSVTKCMNEEKTDAAINKTFKRLGLINYKLCQVELAKSEIEPKEPIIVGFFIPQYA